MIVAGFGKEAEGEDNEAVAVTEGWRLLKATKCVLKKAAAPKPFFNVTFCIQKGPETGGRFVDQFYIHAEAISRLNYFCSRADYPEDLLEAGDIQEEKVVGLIVWAYVILKESNDGKTFPHTDGWKFRSLDNPPEQEGGATRDYTAQDQLDNALAELD